jgi:hypothetical protein
MNVRHGITVMFIIGIFLCGPAYNAGADEKGCLNYDRCEIKVDNCRCTVHGQCESEDGNTCYELKECNLDGQWVHWSCHYSTMGYKQCPAVGDM